jgi:hypothetical protein
VVVVVRHAEALFGGDLDGGQEVAGFVGQPGVDFEKPFRPKFTVKPNLVKFMLITMIGCIWLQITLKA